MAKSVKTKKAKTDETQNVVVKTFQKVSDDVTEMVKDYNEKYLSKAIDKGKKTVKEYNDKYISKAIDKGKDYLDKPYKTVSEAIDEALEKGREIEKDAMNKFDDYVKRGRKIMYKVPMVETFEKKMTDGLNALPGLVNMPTKKEIKKLTLAMEALNSNIETLKRQNIL